MFMPTPTPIIYSIYIVINYSVLEFYTRKQPTARVKHIHPHASSYLYQVYIYHIYQIPFARISAPAN